jgi:hypothetical protein
MTTTKHPPTMRRYVILSNRKRVIIALVHTVAFLLLAVYTGTSPSCRRTAAGLG